MFKTKDFYFKRIYNIKGKKIGIVEDVYLDFYSAKIIGFKVSNHKLFSKKNYVSMEDVIEIGKDIIAYEIKIETGLAFKDIKTMEIIDTYGNIKGVLEDIIIDKQDYSIKGLVVSSGLIDKLVKGKEIILINCCILGEKYILYTGKKEVVFKTMPHNMEKKDEFKTV